MPPAQAVATGKLYLTARGVPPSHAGFGVLLHALLRNGGRSLEPCSSAFVRGDEVRPDAPGHTRSLKLGRFR